MANTTHVLIGGGLASYEAAKTIRKQDDHARIHLVCAEHHLPYDRPPLSKELIRGDKSADDIMYSPASFFDQQNITVHLGTSATGLDVNDKQVTLDDGTKLTFDKAFLATGGQPVRLDVPGANLNGIHCLRTVDDSVTLRKAAEAGGQAVIVGGGFIGVELAASLTQAGMSVTVLERTDHIWSRFAGAGLAEYLQRYCSDRGVTFVTNDSVTEFRGNGHVQQVVTAEGRQLDCSLVCVAIGIRLNLELAEQAGLNIDNGVVVDEHLQTSCPDVYAGGDIINFYDPTFDVRRRVEHWGHAEYCGQTAGRTMAGDPQQFNLLNYVWSDVFDLHMEFAGYTADHDQTILRGNYEDDTFTILYLKDNTLRAFFAVNVESKHYAPLRKLITSKKDLSDKLDSLADESVSTRDLLKL